jgi:hypothetical protein
MGVLERLHGNISALEASTGTPGALAEVVEVPSATAVADKLRRSLKNQTQK